MLRKILFSPLTSSTFSYGRHRCFQLRLFSSNKKVYELNATQVEERLSVLREVYSPLMNYKKGSQEWTNIIKSGKIWENYFCPFEWRAKDYDFQAKYGDFLKEIDALKAFANIPAVDLLRSMTVSFSQQSCAIEGNTLGLYDTQKVWNSLRRNYNLDNFLKDPETPLPAPSSLSDEPENEVIEIRNHLLATHFLYSTLYGLTHEIDLHHIKRLHRILLKDTPMEKIELEDDTFHANKDELIQHAGDFRKIEVESRGSIYTVYPLPMEVPALMERFIQFRDENISSGLHPIIIACRILSTFLHIHPFIDGNGRVGRSIMALYLIRNGYPPIVFQQVPREQYGATLFLAQAEKDSTGLYALVAHNIFNILMRHQAMKE